MQDSKTSRFRYTQEELNKVTEVAAKNLSDLYEYFGVRYVKTPKIMISNCFIHGGDNKQALSLYYNADYRIHYKCRSHHCEKQFGTSLLSMVRGALSHLKHDWKSPGDQVVSFYEAVEFLIKRYDIEGGVKSYTNHDFTNLVKAMTPVERKRGHIDRAYYLKHIKVPSEYFLGRGFSKEVLVKYDVGDCFSDGKPMFERATVPIYDEEGSGILGFSGRSMHEQCKKCHQYHHPERECVDIWPKWRNTRLEKEKCLYNYHYAKSFVQDLQTIILVESPGNVWRLEEAGIHNSVALLGTALNLPQKEIIDESGAINIIVIMDNDENNAGQLAAEEIASKCRRIYNTHILQISKEDIACMSVDEVRKELLPQIEEIQKNRF
jgi:hypothetical protein